MLKLLSGLWTDGSGLLVGLVLVVNWIAAFALARMFGLIFAGDVQQMTVRSPEPLWLMVMPMTLGVGFTLHLPLILQVLDLLPSWAEMSKDLALALTWSSVFGFGVGVLLYVNRRLENPAQLVPTGLRNLLAYDFYTPRIYRSTVVLGVAVLSTLADWLDRYLVDGLVNLVGFASLVSGETLKYNNSGRFQFYMLTISICVAVISIVMSWRYLPNLFTAALSF
jgi:NAD(P)H-quinone oxidoreductase subunit 5